MIFTFCIFCSVYCQVVVLKRYSSASLEEPVQKSHDFSFIRITGFQPEELQTNIVNLEHFSKSDLSKHNNFSRNKKKKLTAQVVSQARCFTLSIALKPVSCSMSMDVANQRLKSVTIKSFFKIANEEKGK